MQITGLLEACLYSSDLEKAEQFYREVLHLEVFEKEADRHVFFRCGRGVFLLFNPEHTSKEQTHVAGSLIPLHGSQGEGHIAFCVAREQLPLWREHFEQTGIEIESEVDWPQGGQSIYIRDPSGNSVELASPEIWGLSV
jgi:catechol 2,3-dioxygenase-like lactoylglutathione lyase family enzyme